MYKNKCFYFMFICWMLILISLGGCLWGQICFKNSVLGSLTGTSENWCVESHKFHVLVEFSKPTRVHPYLPSDFCYCLLLTIYLITGKILTLTFEVNPRVKSFTKEEQNHLLRKFLSQFEWSFSVAAMCDIDFHLVISFLKKLPV